MFSNTIPFRDFYHRYSIFKTPELGFGNTYFEPLNPFILVIEFLIEVSLFPP